MSLTCHSVGTVTQEQKCVAAGLKSRFAHANGHAQERRSNVVNAITRITYRRAVTFRVFDSAQLSLDLRYTLRYDGAGAR